jgi:hypothetical protein
VSRAPKQGRRKKKAVKATSYPRAMPSRSRTQVTGRISWVISCILYYKYNKDKFLISESTYLNAANTTTKPNILSTKISLEVTTQGKSTPAVQ